MLLSSASAVRSSARRFLPSRFASFAGVGVTVFEARNGVAWLTWLQQLPQTAALHWDELRATGALDQSWTWMVLLPALATLALLGGVAVYLASERQ